MQMYPSFHFRHFVSLDTLNHDSFLSKSFTRKISDANVVSYVVKDFRRLLEQLSPCLESLASKNAINLRSVTTIFIYVTQLLNIDSMISGHKSSMLCLLKHNQHYFWFRILWRKRPTRLTQYSRLWHIPIIYDQQHGSTIRQTCIFINTDYWSAQARYGTGPENNCQATRGAEIRALSYQTWKRFDASFLSKNDIYSANAIYGDFSTSLWLKTS